MTMWERIFGGKTADQLFVAVARTFLQGFLAVLTGSPLLTAIGVPGLEQVGVLQAALLGGVSAVVALLHGLVQDPEARSTKEALKSAVVVPNVEVVAPVESPE